MGRSVASGKFEYLTRARIEAITVYFYFIMDCVSEIVRIIDHSSKSLPQLRTQPKIVMRAAAHSSYCTLSHERCLKESSASQFSLIREGRSPVINDISLHMREPFSFYRQCTLCRLTSSNEYCFRRILTALPHGSRIIAHLLSTAGLITLYAVLELLAYLQST